MNLCDAIPKYYNTRNRPITGVARRPRRLQRFYHAGCLTDAMLGLMEKTGSDAQANLASTAEVCKALQSPR